MKVLLLDTNISSLPIYEYLVSLGHEVFVVGANKDDTLAISCSNFINLDYSNVLLISELLKNGSFDIIIPGCNDVSYKTASILNKNKLNISPPDINEIINNKYEFKKFALSHNIKVPRIYSKSEIGNIESRKIIVKPVDAYSGNGISVLSDFSLPKINIALEYAESNSISKECIIEEFVSGNLFSHSAFIKDGEYFEDFIVQEYCTINPYSVDTSWVVEKENFNFYKNIREEVKKIINNLKLCDGLIHTQFIVDGDNFWILEVTRRCPGDLYSKLIEYSTNFDYSKYYVDFILNTVPTAPISCEKNNILRKTITFKDETLWYSIKNNNDMLKIIEFFPLTFAGKRLQIAPKGRAGIVFYLSSNSKFIISEL
jgi:predicted ATP-grasp superfamily ATP-dependent carboligase